MVDREKVIKGIDICLQRFRCGEDCPYYNDAKSGCMEQLREDAIALLKEQEAIEPKAEPSAKGYWYTCGVCGWWLFEVRDTVHFDDRKRIRFCASCGRLVKWGT